MQKLPARDLRKKQTVIEKNTMGKLRNRKFAGFQFPSLLSQRRVRDE